MDNLGAIGGPLLAIALVATVGTRWAIGLSVIPGLLAAVAIIYAIRHTAVPHEREHRTIKLRIAPVLHGTLGRLFAGISAFELGNCAATLMILRATQLLEPGHGRDRATTIAIGLYVAYNVAATVTSIAAGHVADRRTPRLVLAVGAAGFAIAYLGFTHDTTNWVSLAPWFVLAGIGIGCAETAEHTAVAREAPADTRGSAFGLLAAIQSLGNFAASAVAGVLWTTLSPSWAFGFLATAMIAATGLIGRRHT